MLQETHQTLALLVHYDEELWGWIGSDQVVESTGLLAVTQRSQV